MDAEPTYATDSLAGPHAAAGRRPYGRTDQEWLPAHQMGRLWKFKVSEVDEWVRQGGAAPDAEGNEEGSR